MIGTSLWFASRGPVYKLHFVSCPYLFNSRVLSLIQMKHATFVVICLVQNHNYNKHWKTRSVVHMICNDAICFHLCCEEVNFVKMGCSLKSHLGLHKDCILHFVRLKK